MFTNREISSYQSVISLAKFAALSVFDQQLVMERLKQLHKRIERHEIIGLLPRAQKTTVNNTKTKHLGLSYIDFLALGAEHGLFYGVRGDNEVYYVRTYRVMSSADEFFVLYKLYSNVELTAQYYRRKLHGIRVFRHDALRKGHPEVVNALEAERKVLKEAWAIKSKETRDERRKERIMQQYLRGEERKRIAREARELAKKSNSTERDGRDSDETQHLDGSDRAISRRELFD